MNDKKRTAIVVAVAALWFAASAVWAGPTRLQVFVTGDKDKAEQLVSELDKTGYGPAAAVPSADGARFRVLTRAYDSYAEANFEKPRLAGLGYRDAFAVEEERAESSSKPNTVFADVPSITRGKRFAGLQLDFHPKPVLSEAVALDDSLAKLDNQSASETALFNKCLALRTFGTVEAGVAALDVFLARFPDSPDAARAKLMKGYWMIRADRPDAARAQFETVVAAHPNRVEAGEAALRVGYLLIKSKTPDAAVLKQFLQVARGHLPATDEVRCEAMLRCAALYHRGKDLDTAEAAYRQIERFASGDPEVQAFAGMQTAGILLEKSWNGKATFAQAREACDDVLARFPDANRQVRATAALMAMETLCYEKDFKPVLKRGDKYIREFNATPEAPLAYYWIAKARLEVGDAAGAVRLLDAVVDANFDMSDRFQRTDFAAAVRRLATEAHKRQQGPERGVPLPERKLAAEPQKVP